MYTSTSYQNSNRRRCKCRWQPPPLREFHSRDQAFFDANLCRTYSARRVDDEEIAALLWELHGRAAQSYRFAPWFFAPNEWPWTWFLACKIDRAEGVISRRYIASGCDDYTNYEVTALLRGGPLESAGETVAALLWNAAPKSARCFPRILDRSGCSPAVSLSEGGRA